LAHSLGEQFQCLAVFHLLLLKVRIGEVELRQVVLSEVEQRSDGQVAEGEGVFLQAIESGGKLGAKFIRALDRGRRVRLGEDRSIFQSGLAKLLYLTFDGTLGEFVQVITKATKPVLSRVVISSIS